MRIKALKKVWSKLGICNEVPVQKQRLWLEALHLSFLDDFFSNPSSNPFLNPPNWLHVGFTILSVVDLWTSFFFSSSHQNWNCGLSWRWECRKLIDLNLEVSMRGLALAMVVLHGFREGGEDEVENCWKMAQVWVYIARGFFVKFQDFRDQVVNWQLGI